MATININTELFKRYAPTKKLELIEQLDPNELMAVTTETITRIVKETGVYMYNSRNRTLRISRDRRRGNSWNSTIEGVYCIKGKLSLDVYCQYSNTDTNTSYPLTSFLGRGDSRIELTRDDRYGNPRTYYFTYDEGDKQRVIRSILLEYVYTKYHDKLKKAA